MTSVTVFQRVRQVARRARLPPGHRSEHVHLATVTLGCNPVGVDVSPDGTRVYVAACEGGIDPHGRALGREVHRGQLHTGGPFEEPLDAVHCLLEIGV